MLPRFECSTSTPDPQIKWSNSFTGSPIVIDNGGFECRAGYAVHDSPMLVFRNCVYRPRMSKTVLVGNDIPDFETVRHYLKSPFMDNLLVNIDVQEQILDHLFDRLSVRSHGVTHPIFINESLCNPAVCRAQLNELLFETYGVPKVSYYVDALASHFENWSRVDTGQAREKLANCLIVSFGHQTTHLLPLIASTSASNRWGKATGSFDREPIFSAARRLQIGGVHSSWLLQRLLQLKYPCHIERLSFGLAERLVEKYGKIVLNYREESGHWKDPTYRKAQTLVGQLPFVEPSAEEMNAFADRKRAQAQRLQDVHRKRQRQQLESNREKLNNLLDLEDVISHTKSGDHTVLSAPLKRSLSRLGLSTVGQLKDEISVCRSAIRRLEDLLSPTTQNTRVSSEPSTPSVASDSDVDSTDSSTEGSKRESIKTVVITNFQPEVSSPSVGSADSSKLEGRQKRAMDLLLTQVLPAAVQAQMIAAPTPTDSRLSEVKLKHRMKMVQDLEASKGEDFLFWLTQLRHKRHKVAKRRALRQSRIDLATEIGLHGPNTPENGETRDTAGPSKPSVGGDTSRGFSASDSATAGSTPHGAADTTASGGDKRAMTERRRMQLAKIRAMAAELKPTRGRGSRANTQQPANRGSRGGQTQGTPPASRGSLQPSGRGRGRGSRGKNALKTMFSNQSHAPNDDEVNDADMSEETRDSWNMDELCDPPSSLPNPWDLDAEDSNSNTIHPEEKSPAVDANKTITPQKPDHSFDPGDESENERDQLVVLDSLLTLYDPEAFKDLGMMGMKASLSEYNQIHLGSEIIRACEVPFQPSFVGSPSAGVSECFEFVLRDVLNHDAEHNLALPPVWPLSVFITGGLASLPGMADRIYSDLRPLLPFGSDGDQVKIVIADNPRLDAWRGARRWAVACPSDAYITREIYEECGADYIVETPLSNRSWFNDGKRAC